MGLFGMVSVNVLSARPNVINQTQTQNSAFAIPTGVALGGLSFFFVSRTWHSMQQHLYQRRRPALTLFACVSAPSILFRNDSSPAIVGMTYPVGMSNIKHLWSQSRNRGPWCGSR